MIGREKLDQAWRTLTRGRQKVNKYKSPDCIALKLECIGGEKISGPGIVGVEMIIDIGNDGDFIRKSIQGFTDYSEGNSVGSRGVYKNYILKSGNIYYVSAPVSWKKINQYYCRIKNNEIIEMNIYQVLAWLKNSWV